MIKMKSIYTRLAIVFISIAILSVIIISIISNISTGIMFRKYVYEKHEKRNKQMFSILQESFKKNGYFSGESLSQTAMYAMMDNLSLKIKDINGIVVWEIDYLKHTNNMPSIVNKGIYTPETPKYSEEEFNLADGGIKIGSVVIGFDGEYSLAYNDLNFLKSFNDWLLVSGLLSVAVAFLISLFISKNIAVPIIKSTEAAMDIKHGKLARRLETSSGILEISELSDTINHLAESLEAQENLRKQLTSDIAHEIRTPLATLQSHTEAIIDGVWTPTEERITGIHEEILRLSTLVDNIEKLNELEEKNEILTKTTFNLSELLANTARNFEVLGNKKMINVKFLGADNVTINADRDKISQIIVNLVSNAIKYTDRGRIDVSVKQEKNDIIIKVKDTGVGIAKEHLPYIFERLYRVDDSRTRETGGTGIGLTIARAIARSHGGDIVVTSEVGIGTEFTVIL